MTTDTDALRTAAQSAADLFDKDCSLSCSGDWQIEVVTRLRAALAAAPQPAMQAQGKRGPLSDVRAMSSDPKNRKALILHYKREVTDADRQSLCEWHNAAISHAAPQPAPEDREALVELIARQLPRSLGNGYEEANNIADALLARGLRLPDADAERDAAFAAGQEEMRERAAKAVLRALYKPVGSATEAERHMDDNMVARGMYEAIRALPIKPHP